MDNGKRPLSREEKFRRESEQRIKNLKPKDYKDGYYIDEYGERLKQERRAKEIHKQETEVIHRHKKPLTQKQFKLRRRLFYSLIFVIVLIIGAVLSLTVLFKTEKIVVEGGKYYYEDQIIAFSGVELQQNIFTSALFSTPEKITENLSYIESVKISFTIPDTITIKVTDAVPSYVIKSGKSYLLISAKGRILENIADNKDKLPELKCDNLTSTKTGDYLSFSDENIPDILSEISNSLNKNKVNEIKGIDITNTANVKLDYDGRIQINLGMPEDIDYKIRTAIIIINEKLDPNKAETISGTLDVSACNTTKTSRYKPAETAAPATTVQPTTAADNYYGADSGDYSWDDSTDYDVYNDDIYSDDAYSDYADDGVVDDGENTYVEG